jgi:hypothetical protein
MTEKQQYYLDIYKSEADKAYESMQDYRIDYDTYKPIADASSIITEQSKKVFEKLYPIYINYPIFLRGLKKIYDNSKMDSDADQLILQEKLNTLNIYKSEYENLINKINALEVEINKDELSAQIDEIANLPENLERSNELVLIENEKEMAAAKAAQEAAEKNALISASISVDKIIGTEVCLDNFGNQVDMSICRPTPESAATSVSNVYNKTASDIVNENIESWLKGIESSFEIKKPIETIPQPINTIVDKPIEEIPTIEEEVESIELEEETIVEQKPEDIINSFIFNADLSKLISSELSSRKTIDETPIKDEINPSDVIEESIVVPNTKLQESNVVIKKEVQPIKRLEITQVDKMLTFGAILIAAIVSYDLIKRKD